jgi:release factor glutamine methyltransferase
VRRPIAQTSIRDALDSAVIALTAAGCDTPRLDAELLLAAAMEVDRATIVADPGRGLEPEAARRFQDYAARRREREPVAYILGRKGFRSIELAVDPRVLIPRPETEHLVDAVLDLPQGARVCDVGTGSGAIALALASEGRADRVIGTDISLDALAVARANVSRSASLLRAPVDLRAGSLLGAVVERPLRAVVSNPPYISWDERDALPPSVRDWEPAVALYSDADGMATTARLVREAGAALEEGGLLALEVDVRRASVVAELVATHGAYDQVQVVLDLTGRERFVVARRRGTE